MEYIGSGRFAPSGTLVPQAPAFSTIAQWLTGFVDELIAHKAEEIGAGSSALSVQLDLIAEGVASPSGSSGFKAQIQVNRNPDGSRNVDLTVGSTTINLLNGFTDVVNEHFGAALLTALTTGPGAVALPVMAGPLAALGFASEVAVVGGLAFTFGYTLGVLIAQEVAFVLEDPYRAQFISHGQKTDFGVYVPEGGGTLDGPIVKFFLDQAVQDNDLLSQFRLNGGQMRIGSSLSPFERATYDIYELSAFEHFGQLTGQTMSQLLQVNLGRNIVTTHVPNFDDRNFTYAKTTDKVEWTLEIGFGGSPLQIVVDRAYDVDGQGNFTQTFGRGNPPGYIPGMGGDVAIATALLTSVSGFTLTGRDDFKNVILGNNVDSFLFGGRQDDVIIGNAQNDQIYGGAGIDRIDGGGGNDLIRGAVDGDVVIGGAGFDTWNFDTSSALSFTVSAAGIEVRGADPAAHASGSGIERIVGTPGGDRFTVASGGLTGFVISGADIQDSLTIDGVSITGAALNSVEGNGVYHLGPFELRLGADGTLAIGNAVKIEHFQNGQLGLFLGGQPAELANDTRLVSSSEAVPFKGVIFASGGTGVDLAAEGFGSSYLLRYDSSGREIATGVKIPGSAAIYTAPSALELSDGSIYFTWHDIVNNSWALMGRHLSASGAPLGAARLIGDGYYSEPATLAQLSDGTVLIGARGGSDSAYIRAFDPASDTLGGTRVISSSSGYVSITALANGTAVAAWYSGYSGPDGVVSSDTLGQIIDSHGQAVGNVFLLNQATAGQQYQPAVTATANGFVAAWIDAAAGVPDGGAAMRVGAFDLLGSATGSQTVVSSGGVLFSNTPREAIATLPDGSVVLAWTKATFVSSGGGGDIYEYDIMARRFTAGGAPLGDEFRVNKVVSGHQTSPTIAVLDDGRFVVGWTDLDTSGSPVQPGYYVRLFDGQGNGVDAGVVLTGTAFADRLDGGSGDDVLNGAAGADHLHGGRGNDRYLVDDIGDRVFEAAGEGVDQVVASVGYVLPSGAEVESLIAADRDGATAINLTGNEFGQLLVGNNGVNILDGGAGADSMFGFGGNDLYLVDNGGDRVVEAAGGGTDRVLTSVSFRLETGSEVEILEAASVGSTAALNLYGNAFNQAIGGNNGDNVIDGGAGADYMVGYGGNDTYLIDDAGDRVVEQVGGGTDRMLVAFSYVLGANDEIESLEANVIASTAPLNLYGNAFNQALGGNNGNNIIDGGGGADYMVGYGGDDTYVVDNPGDRVIEVAGGGTDRLLVAFSYVLAANDEIETLEASSVTSTEPLNLYGNAFNQAIGGNNGSNIIDGGGGADYMVGYGGNDTYVIDNAGDRVIEAVGGGVDRVLVSATFILAAGNEIEQIEVNGTATTTAIDLYGNEFAQALGGNNGENALDGRGGNDLLVGYGGSDTFVFSTALGAGNVDRIGDFAGGVDKIALSRAVFTALAPGALTADELRIGASAQDEDDRIIYDPTNGGLFYDADGNGAGSAIRFATLDNRPATIGAGDFSLIGSAPSEGLAPTATMLGNHSILWGDHIQIA